MANSIAFMDQLQGASYQSLSATSFQVGIVDPDSAHLTTSQIRSLEATGKSLIGYLSIGEAENYRGYWQSSWDTSKPSWILGENPNWPGDYNVKFWDPAWQNIIINQATAMAKAGYNGLMLDVVDAYSVASVAAADGGIAHARADMVKFVEAISAATKAINPDFKIIQNNALDLLTINPNDPSSATNTAYLSHIDGVLAESTFYNPNNTATTWGAWNEQYLHHAVDAGKTVLVLDYPTSATAQNAFIAKAIADGFVPYVANQNLDSNIQSVNYQIPGELPAGAMASLLVHTTTAPPPVITPSPYHVTVIPDGKHTLYANTTYAEFDAHAGFSGNTIIKYFGTDAHDVVGIDHTIYSTVADVMSHITYSGANGIIHLPNGHSTITIAAAGNHGLIAADFLII